MFKLIKKLLIWLGFIKNPNTMQFEAVTDSCGGILEFSATVDGTPPAMDELYEMTQKQGFTGPKEARLIGDYLREQGLCPIWHNSHWSLEVAPSFCYPPQA